ncbi:MAG: AMP-binding protein [Deltaproteobacteria bacterium]|nr:AMP-binding protein [Deltaproteobacteria bacterium]
MRLWDAENEQMEREDLEQLQLERLQSTLNRAYKNVPFYRKEFDELGIDPGALSSVQEITRLPFTTREDLGDNYPYGMFAMPLRDIVRISSSTGTTPKPVVVGYTILNPGLSNWGRALKEGAENIGASVMPMSHMSTSKQLLAMRDYKTSVFIATPSYAMHMVEVMGAIDIDTSALALKAIVLVGEALKQETRERLESTFKIDVTASYGPSDVMGPGLAFECMEKDGLHISEDHFLLEIVASDGEAPCAPGEEGEVVLTTLTAKAVPFIRFRTGDLASMMAGACPCGRTLARMSGITGHTGEVVTIRGVKVHPAQIDRIIKGLFQGFSPRFLIHLYKESYQDMTEIWLEMNEAIFSDEVKILEGTLKHLREQVLEMLGLHVTIRLVEAETIEQYAKASGGVLDER